MIQSSRRHLTSVNEGYFEHQAVAFRYGFSCLRVGLMALVHGVVPGWFETSASDLVKKLATGRKGENGPID